MRAEDKKSVSGKDLTAKIAKVSHSVSPEQQGRSDADYDDIQNPELDQAFNKMVERYKSRRPQREGSVVNFPAVPARSMPKPDQDPVPEYECQECGHNNPSGNQFCGICGGALEDAQVVLPTPTVRPQEPEPPASACESGIRHYHHHYHHDHYRNNPYLLLAVVLLMGTIVLQQWQEFQRREAPEIAAPASMPPPLPAQAQPNPVSGQMSTVPLPDPSAQPAPPPQLPMRARTNPLPRHRLTVAVPGRSVQPAMQPAAISTVPPSNRPVHQEGPQRPHSPAPQPSLAPPIAPYQILTDQAIPAFPQFSRMPPKARAAK